jgi:hypothetical protein
MKANRLSLSAIKNERPDAQSENCIAPKAEMQWATGADNSKGQNERQAENARQAENIATGTVAKPRTVSPLYRQTTDPHEDSYFNFSSNFVLVEVKNQNLYLSKSETQTNCIFVELKLLRTRPPTNHVVTACTHSVWN